MMRIYSRACEALPFCNTIILPLATGKNAIIGVIVTHINSICLTELLKSSLGCADIVTILVCHQVNIAKI